MGKRHLYRNFSITVNDFRRRANFVKLAAALHSNLTVAAIDDIGPNDWFEPATDDCTATFNCVAHTVQLATMKDVFDADDDDDDIKSLVARVRKLCTAFNTSPHKAALLASAQAAANRAQLAVVRDVPTRWLSLHAMLDRFVTIYPDVLFLTLQGKLNPTRGGEEERDVNDFITPSELQMIRRFVEVLRPIAEFVNDIEGEKYVTLAAVPVLLLRCLRTLDDNAADDNSTKALKRRLRASLTKRLGYIVNEPNLALAAAAFDPRFGHLRFVDDGVRERLVDALVDWTIEFPKPVGNGVSIDIEIDEATERSLLRSTYTSLRRHLLAKAPPQCANDELYLPTEVEAKRYDAFEFWRTAEGLDNIRHIARLVLCVPATSAPSERVFSSAGFIVNKNRARLDDENVVMLATIRDHLKRLVTLDQRKKFLDGCLAKLKEAADKSK